MKRLAALALTPLVVLAAAFVAAMVREGFTYVYEHRIGRPPGVLVLLESLLCFGVTVGMVYLIVRLWIWSSKRSSPTQP